MLDSSIVRAVGFPHDAALSMVRILAERNRHTVALSESIWHQYLSHRRRDLEKKGKAAQAAVADLLGSGTGVAGREGWTGLRYPDVDTVIKEVEERLRTVFHVVPLTEAAAKAGLQREASRHAPASTGEKAGGARDASI